MYIETPPALTASPELYSYLYRLSESLNVALNQVEQQITVKTENAVQTAVESAKNGGSFEGLLDLKALIVNTAQIVRREMDVITTQLHGEYEAVSEQFGSFRENLESTITATANGILQQYDFETQIKALGGSLESYQTRTEGYIRQGFIGYEEDGITPQIGIAIGRNLSSTTVTLEDGQTLEQLKSDQSCAFYTDRKMSFRIGGEEVAYVSDRKLYILDAEITGSLTVGDWLISHGTAGLTLRCIGG